MKSRRAIHTLPFLHPTDRQTSRHRQRRQVHQRIRRAQPVHKRVLLHPASVMCLLVAGVFIAGWTLHAAAASYGVTAKVSAPPLTDGAVITSPTDGAIFTSTPITVSGTCPDSSYVKLFRNTTFSGVAWCNSNTFSIDTSLATGSNVLQAQDYNTTDDPGPTTPSITVVYHPPVVTPPPGGGSTAGQTPGTAGNSQVPGVLSLESSYRYQAFKPGYEAVWRLSVAGGVSPYTIKAIWGDGQIFTLGVAKAGAFSISHAYAIPGYYAFKVYATDSQGRSAMLQLAAFIRSTEAVGGIATPTGGGVSSSSNWLDNILGGLNHWLWLAWPTYGTVVLMAASFWLGERQAVQRAMQQVTASRSRARAHRSH